jgi:hypothetical protein
MPIQKMLLSRFVVARLASLKFFEKLAIMPIFFMHHGGVVILLGKDRNYISKIISA